MNDRMNTIFGWVLGSGIVALGGAIVSGMYFHSIEGTGAGYPIEAAEEGAGAQPAEDMLPIIRAANAEDGASVFARCASCHTVEQGGADGIGPNLYGVMGTGVGGHAAGFAYSEALTGHGGTWDYDTMDAWLENPAAFAPGTKMTFAGLSSAQDRANVIAYMLSNGGDMGMLEAKAAAMEAAAPAEEPAAEEGAEEAPAEEAAAE
ncbi:c-type cytochrome [Aurantiacibacter sp. D1-12]|uniref:c-type cytochrome n=1 Tax=Aurantiacibacter sp. D1-12 TaxID=2993658 RepID=UPI00237CF359|nr:cytochrome c family protein [Aurantiacibacter sp. D1-12]MDE1467180.1 cytochrome c family protein [Aurantiacibacter sp. D1-12]